MPQTYNNLPTLAYNNTPYWNTLPTNYDQSYNFLQNSSNKKRRKTNDSTNKNFPNTQRKKCLICSKTNHAEDKCFFKNKSNSNNCQICNKPGHTANNCNLLNTADNCSPYITATPMYKINKINSTPDALFIETKFNNTTLPITIDTGANICCIRQELLPNNYTITPTTVKLSGLDNKPLCVAGITKIQLKINNNYFDVNTHVVKNLSSTIILGNDFLIKNNTLIDFKDDNIILNNNINVQLKINIMNGIKGSIFDCPDNFAIAHCISSDFKMNKGITNLICKVYVPTLDSEPHKFDWSIVKQLLYSEFQNTNIEIHIYYRDKINISSKEHTDIINNINTQCKIINQAHDIFSNYKHGENVLNDGNCGLYAD
ncbi:Uncharacterized protein FWK35_00025892 [Aphis craccivora]|uniref:Retropepsins domain-containing protein n=1 Tax=Aphis craccivora TaxID=307492 RepID=A0A6G0W008_APHCR|nr:Uncharacterized protein FWK35_00025892 [Aphis craccivora]